MSDGAERDGEPQPAAVEPAPAENATKKHREERPAMCSVRSVPTRLANEERAVTRAATATSGARRRSATPAPTISARPAPSSQPRALERAGRAATSAKHSTPDQRGDEQRRAAAAGAPRRRGQGVRRRVHPRRMVTRAGGPFVLRADDRARHPRGGHRFIPAQRHDRQRGRRHGDGRGGTLPSMRTWTASKHIDADPAVVLDVLTDPEPAGAGRRSPSTSTASAGGRLAAGARMRVSGQLVGRRVGFDVEVHEAGDGRLALTARGPVAFDVAYEAEPPAAGARSAPRSPSAPAAACSAGVAEQATAALLHAGALGVAVDRIAASAAA